MDGLTIIVLGMLFAGSLLAIKIVQIVLDLLGLEI